MGYEYNKLLKRYGLSTPELSYAGAEKPKDVLSPDYNSLFAKYQTDTNSYGNWLKEYQRRIGALDLYGPDFQGAVLGRPAYAPTAESQVVGTFISPTTGNVVTYDAAGVHTDTGKKPTADTTAPTPTTETLMVDRSAVPRNWFRDRNGIGAATDNGFQGDANSYTGGLLGQMIGQDPMGVSVTNRDVYSDAARAEREAASQGYGGSGHDQSGDGASGGSHSGDSSHGDAGASDHGGGGGAGDGGGDARGGIISARRPKIPQQKFAAGGLANLYTKYAEGGEVEHHGLDLSRVTPRQLAFLQKEDPAALQRGVATFANYGAPRPQAEQAPADELASMLSAPAGDRSAHYTKAEDRLTQAQEQFNQLVQAQMGQKTEGPSRAEMYFRLAAAFGAPTKTGSFTESMGNAGTVLGDYARDQRAASTTDQAIKQKLGLELGKRNIDSAQDVLNTEKALAIEAMKDQRALKLDLYKQGRPQSEAGKIAADSGLRPGTPEYNQFVSNYVTDKIESGKAFKEAIKNVAVGNLSNAQVRTDLATAANTRAEREAAMLTPKEASEITKEQVALDAKTSLMKSLEQAYQLSKTALPGSGVGRLTATVLGAVGHPSPAVQSKEQLDQLLDQAALEYAARLKPMSDTDILFAQKLTGVRGSTPESRAAQIQQLYKQSANEIKQHEARINAIRSQANRVKTAPSAMPTGEE